METQGNKKKQLIAALAVLVVIAGLIGSIIANSKKDSGQTLSANTSSGSSGTSSDTGSTANDSSSTSSTSSYKDGTYSATGRYVSPGGQQSISVSITLQNGTVTDTSAKSGAIDDESAEFQGDFINGYKQLVVGKSIGSIRLSRVSGSSLTSQGFNSALDQIKQQAQA